MNLIYKCPVCNKRLIKTDNALRCDQKHSYDISNRGYVNLLLANQKKTKEPGDSKAMIENRKYFLEQGHYDILSDKLNKIILEWIDQSPTPSDTTNILDLGCGEGFYSARLLASIRTKHRNQIRLWGIDISKAAIQKAASRETIVHRPPREAGSDKRDPRIQFCIGSNFQLPYLDESFDIVFSIFSPFDTKELTRVLKPGGKMIVVRPGASHLKELASLIYEQFELQGNSSNLAQNPDLRPIQTIELKYQIHLQNKQAIKSLIGMTPYFWSLNEDKKLLLAQKQELITTVDFRLSLFQK